MECEFPPGWKKEPTDHSMWSKLMDDKGRERAAIFYKAAFYDQSAHVTLSNRFSATLMPVEGWDASSTSGKKVGVVTDCGKVVFQTNPTGAMPEAHDKRSEWYADQDAKRAEATAWLDNNYPDWKNAAAYWD